MTQRRRLIVTLGVIVLALAGLAAWFVLRPGPQAAQNVAEGQLVEHAAGSTRIPAAPTSVLVYDPASLDILDALGVQVKGVGGQNLPDYLARYAKPPYENVGSLFEADMEKVAAMRPDLVIVGGRSRRQYETLAPVAPTIDMSTGDGDRVEATIRKTEQLARIFGKQQRGAELVADLRASLDRTRKVTAGAGRGLVILTTGGRMSAFTPEADSRFGFVHSAFGVTPAMPTKASGAHGNRVTAEFIRQVDPDWLFVVDRDTATGRVDAEGKPVARTGGGREGGQRGGGRGGRNGGGGNGSGEGQDRPGMGARQTLDNPLIAQTKAWKQGHVVYLDPRSWYIVGGGIQNLRRMSDEIATAMSRDGSAPAN